MPHEVKIIHSAKMPVTSGPRVGQLDSVISYQTADGSGGIVVIPKQNPTDQEIKDAIKKDLDERGALIGKTFTI